MRPTVLPLLIPGTVFWTLVILGVATGNAEIWAAASVVGVVTTAVVLFLVARSPRSR